MRTIGRIVFLLALGVTMVGSTTMAAPGAAPSPSGRIAFAFSNKANSVARSRHFTLRRLIDRITIHRPAAITNPANAMGMAWSITYS